MPRIPYPNVPNQPGVPQVLRSISTNVPPVVGTAAGIAQLVRSFTSRPVWGIFKPDEGAVMGADGIEEVTVVAKRTPVVTPDSIVGFGYQKETAITSAPTQKGAFVDYNRAAIPFEIRLRMTKGGSEKDRAAFIKQIEDLDTTQLYDIITPEKTYINCNITRFELLRENESGAFWFRDVDLYFREVRVVNSRYTNTSIVKPKSVSAANVQNNGTQQGQSTTASVPQTVTQ